MATAPFCVQALFVSASPIFLFAIFAAVYFFFFVCQDEDLIQFLLNGSDTAGIFAPDHIDHLFGQMQIFLFGDLPIFDHVHGNIVVDKAQNIQIQHINGTFHFDDIFFAHFIAAGIFDDSYAAVQFIQFQMCIRDRYRGCGSFVKAPIM